ncbi:MAG TPA: hypothetical protein VGB91_11165 [Rhizomicrobium sp.]
MSSKKDKGPDRRAIIAAAAAGAALPLAAGAAKAQGGMMMGGGMMGREGSRFVVDLGGVRLPDDVAAKLEGDIRRAVLMAVARAYPRTKFGNGILGPGTRGIILRPELSRGEP